MSALGAVWERFVWVGSNKRAGIKVSFNLSVKVKIKAWALTLRFSAHQRLAGGPAFMGAPPELVPLIALKKSLLGSMTIKSDFLLKVDL